MRGRAISFLLLILFLSAGASADCSWVPRYSGQYRSTAYDVAIDSEGLVWVASGYGVTLLEPAAAGKLTFADAAAIPGSTRVIAVAGNIAYAGSGSRVFILRRTGRTFEVVRSIDAGGTVNDIAVVSTYLFVATSKGIAHFDVFDPTLPVRTSAILSTSRLNVTSLAVLGTKLYAADGDASVEIFTISIPALPQGTGSLESLPSSTSVQVTTSDERLYISDDLGQNTDIFIGTSRTARIGYGTNAFAPLGKDAFFAAGPQRIFRALEITDLTRVAELFEDQLLPFGGTSNRIFAMARGGNTLYIAAGDMGLITYDVGVLISPHPLISYADGGRSSVQAVGDKAYFSATLGVTVFLIQRAGISMPPIRAWGVPSALLHDSTTTTLLGSTGADLKTWRIDTEQTPAETFSKTLAANVRTALLTSTAAIALLVDNSVWRVPLDGTAPQRITVDGGTVRDIVRSGTAIALVQVTDDAKTIVRYYANGDLTAAPHTFNLDGAAFGGLALNSTTAAVFTFQGISLIDLGSGAVRVLPDSNRLIPLQLLFTGNDLLVLSSLASTLAVWDTSNNVLRRESSLPASPLRMHVSGKIALIASTTGPMAIDYTVTLPNRVSAIDNRYYKKAAAAGDFLYLQEDGRIDVFWTGKGAAPRFVTSISAPGTSGIAALPETLFALGFGDVTSYSTAGVQLARTTLEDGTQPSSITTAGNAVWVSLVSGCSSGTCARKTLVLDPKTLAVTATMNGGATRVVTSGTRAYALFELPDQVRVIDIANPLQPSLVMAEVSPALASDIGYFGGKVYVLADRIYGYTESLLATGTSLSSVAATQSMAIDGDCAVITGRNENPDFYTLPLWNQTSAHVEIPSPVRMLAQQPGRLFVLTDHSIEVWTTAPPPSPPRRRAAR